MSSTVTFYPKNSTLLPGIAIGPPNPGPGTPGAIAPDTGNGNGNAPGPPGTIGPDTGTAPNPPGGRPPGG